MQVHSRLQTERRSAFGLRAVAGQVFSRTAGAPLTPGNSVRLLIDARENYPVWLEAIAAAEHAIYFESFIIHEDQVGRAFADALIAKAGEGVKVRLIYDWLGSVGKTSRGFWNRLRRAGVEVRGFNPPRLDSPFGWFTRDHRKCLVVDRRVAFVTGLCVGRMWAGDEQRGVAQWRDTGVEVRGPAVADVLAAFAESWAECGSSIPAEELAPSDETTAPAGDVDLRVIAGTPYLAGLYRLDQLVAAIARKSLWITDAYFLGTTTYVQALRAAAMDGVDVRLLVPGASDIQFIVPFSRAVYRGLLEAGVRIFEWNGPMLHAKTAVADSHWARVGSSNLNIASWMGNWELDVAIENDAFAGRMEEMYLADLANSTEVVLSARQRVRPVAKTPRRIRRGTGKAGRVAAAAIGVGKTVGAAIANRRVMGAAEAKVLAAGGLLLLLLAVLAWLRPRGFAVPFAVMAVWTGISLLIRAIKLRRP
jgi:cardiolipin synthase